MTDVQLEYGYTRIPNATFDAMISRLRGLQLNVAMLVVRESYGWNQSTTKPMGYGAMSKKLNGVPRSSVQLAINVLYQAKVLKRHADGSWELEQNHEIWTLPSEADCTAHRTPVTREGVRSTVQGETDGCTADRTPSREEGVRSTVQGNPEGVRSTVQECTAHRTGGVRSTVQGLYKEFKDSKKDSVKTARARRAPCQPPTLEEVKAYCRERNRGVNAAKWHNHYSANGWMVGKVPMVDWKAAVRTWEEPETEEQARARVESSKPRCGRCMTKGNWVVAKSSDGKTGLCKDCKYSEDILAEDAAGARA